LRSVQCSVFSVQKSDEILAAAIVTWYPPH
jgi:hypothetical protein